MTKQRQKRLSTGAKITLWILGLLIAWQFLRLPEIIDAILTFCLAGVVPGTDIVLSPDAVIRIAATSVGAIIVIVALVPIIKRKFTKRTDLDEPTAPEQPPVLQPADAFAASHHKTPEKPVVITPAEAFRQQVYVTEVAELTQLEANPAQKAGAQWLGSIGTAVYGALNKVMPRVLLLLAKAIVALRPKLIFIKEHAVRLAGIIKVRAIEDFWWMVAKAKVFWHWLVPYLWQFDGWLELKVRALEARLKHKVHNHDTASTVVDLGRHAKKSIRELDVHTKVKKVTSKAKPYAKKAHHTTKKAVRTVRKRVQK